MDLEEIKNKFRHKTSLDIKDLDLALASAPVLIRELDRLEKDMIEKDKQIEHLKLQLRKGPPSIKKGKRGQAMWMTKVDDEKNRLYLSLAGKFDYNSAKTASNSVVMVMEHIREGFDLINDISKMNPEVDNRVMFHVKKLIYHLELMKVKRIIHIINPENPQIVKIFDNPGAKKSYKAYTVKSVKEASAILKSLDAHVKT